MIDQVAFEELVRTNAYFLCDDVWHLKGGIYFTTIISATGFVRLSFLHPQGLKNGFLVTPEVIHTLIIFLQYNNVSQVYDYFLRTWPRWKKDGFATENGYNGVCKLCHRL